MPVLRLAPVTAFDFTPEGKIEAEKIVLRLNERGVHARMGNILRNGSPTMFSVMVPDMEMSNARRVLGIEFQTGGVSHTI